MKYIQAIRCLPITNTLLVVGDHAYIVPGCTSEDKNFSVKESNQIYLAVTCKNKGYTYRPIPNDNTVNDIKLMLGSAYDKEVTNNIERYFNTPICSPRRVNHYDGEE